MNPDTPKQKDGSCLDTRAEVIFQNQEEAIKHFDSVKRKLFNVNKWFDYCENTHSNFCLCEKDGNEKMGDPKIGDVIKISVKGIDNNAGNGDDWVTIEEFVDSDNSVSFTVRPCTAPVNDSEEIAHFFDERSSNTFGVKRIDNKVIVEINGRNEHINLDSNNLIQNVRNAAMALGGIVFGSKAQWETLAKGLISEKS